MKYRWSIMPDQPVLSQHLAQVLGISPLLAQCLVNRGLSEPILIQAFLAPRLKNLADPFRIPNMAVAVDRLLEARLRAQSVVLFGDYDVDGITATTLLLEVLKRLGLRVRYFLPHRMEDGYGLSSHALDSCWREGPFELLVAVDCGSTSLQPIADIKQRGVDTIVLDHHVLGPDKPDALAIVNPHLNGTQAPFRELCSVGLAFKLAHALLKRAREQNLDGADLDLREFLDLVALGTIADLVPLIGENRILVTAGLQRLNQTTRLGLRALMEVAGTQLPVRGHEVAFQLAPRLNAAGRLETANQSMALLLSNTIEEADRFAQSLDTCNRERQEIERSISASLAAVLRERPGLSEEFVFIEAHQNWHIGVVGIVASRICQEFYRPTIVLGGDGEDLRGSGRSIEGFDLVNALRDCSDLLIKFGGHSMAAGVSIKPGRIGEFRRRLNEIAKQRIHPELLQPRLQLDGEINAHDLTLERARELERLDQTGIGNPPVRLCCRAVRHHRPLSRIGKEKKHVKFWITQGSQPLEAVWWGGGDKPLPVGTFDLVFTPKVNYYQGQPQLQLQVLDWNPSF